ncbi:MAG: tetratricopeptide repeat protein [Novosphingobium sp.]
MTVRFSTCALLAAAALTLPGCSALFGTNKLASQTASPSEHAAQAAPAAVAAFTDAGRAALDKGSTGLAIEAFRRAVTSGEAPAPAFNGLGVAYARVGRFDLAQRYFERAAQIDPANGRYQANLARLMRSPLFARRHEADETRALMAQAEQQQAAARTRQAAAPGQLQRLGANQFFIQTAAPAAASKGPVRTAMVIARNKTAPAVKVQSVEAAFDASVGKPATAPAAADPDKATPRTVMFTSIPTARP